MRVSRASAVGLLILALGTAAWSVEPRVSATPAGEAQQLLARAGVDRGIAVLVAKGASQLPLDLARQSQLTVYVQLPDDASVDQLRKQADAAGLLGTHVYVEKGTPGHLHLANNLADFVVVASDLPASDVPVAELLRSVRPLGKILLGPETITKPFPSEADDWTHPYYAPDNNPQSRDQLAKAPYLTQFLAEPWYVPFPEVTVTSRGRVFKAFGHVGYKKRDWPWLNTLIALDGYNGTMLWKRSLEAGFNIHRNTMIATPDILYVADSSSCKLLDTATGKLKGEIRAPDSAAGPVWKWMALENNILYALVGEPELRDKDLRGTRTDAGWPWRPMTEGYDSAKYRWGFGRSFFAIDLTTRKVLWTHTEQDQIDSRAVCMKADRIFYYSHPKFLACLDARQGRPVWRTSDSAILKAIGPHNPAQNPSLGFSTSAYVKCSDKAVYFAGPQRERLVAVSADDGRLLWQYPHGNFQLILRGEGLFAMGRTGASKLFDPLSGAVLADLPAFRGNCTRATGTVDCVFARGHEHGGTLRLATADNSAHRMALMRPDCHDGVIVSGGMLYWGPWMCDCNLSLVGIICLGPAGDFQFQAEARPAERLEAARDVGSLEPLTAKPGDWPTYRADNQRSAASRCEIPQQVRLAWQYRPKLSVDMASPVTAGGLTILSGSDGVLRAVDGATGKARWTAYTGGSIFFPPSIDQNRLLVGSNDGWVYAFEAATGRELWRFRAAPVERKINLYGRLSSTWPVASGALAQDGVVYAAAGIASYDGTHVYALDAATGRIRWQNNTSDRLAGPDSVSGVSVQGHLLLDQGRLYLAGGNVVSPAVYDIKDGHCFNTLTNEWIKAPRGRDLFLLDGKVVAFERLLYSPKEYWPGRYYSRHLVQADSGDVLIRGTQGRIVRIAAESRGRQKPAAAWESKLFDFPVALALGTSAVVVAGRITPESEEPAQFALAALATTDGHVLWRESLPAMPIPWGLALDHAGRTLVTLEDGHVMTFAGP